MIRIILAGAALAAVTAPSFAAPLCQACRPGTGGTTLPPMPGPQKRPDIRHTFGRIDGARILLMLDLQRDDEFRVRLEKVKAEMVDERPEPVAEPRD